MRKYLFWTVLFLILYNIFPCPFTTHTIALQSYNYPFISYLLQLNKKQFILPKGKTFKTILFHTLIDKLLLGCRIKFSCILIKWCSFLDKVTIPSLTLFTPSPTLVQMNWPINEVHINKIKTNFPCQYIHVYPISVHTLLDIDVKLSFVNSNILP